MSALDRHPSNIQGCFGFCISHEDPNQDTLKPQRNHDKVSLSTEDQRKKKEIDSMLSEAMNELSFEERQYQQEVLHGVEDQIAEEATFIQSALEELDFHLHHAKRGSAYETAERMDPAYVRGKPLRLMFLRCNQYDGKAAADQMFQFFRTKKDLFGLEKLVREITIEDLNEDDRASLETGWVQSVGKDRSDRVVYMCFPGLRAFKELKNELRGKFYFMMSLLQSSEEIQFKGVAEITYSVDEFRDNQNGAGYIDHAQLMNAIPLKHAALHLCTDVISEYFLCDLAIKVMPAKLRSRFRCHFGSHLECQYLLSTYGVSKMLIPLDASTGAINLLNHQRWFQSCLPQVESGCRVGSASPDAITLLSANDVLFGGKIYYHHSGNQRLRTLLLEWSPVYDSPNFETKRTVIDNIIHAIQRSGGRFLKGESGVPVGVDEVASWVPVPQEDVKKKIAQLFRNRRRASTKRKVVHKDDSR